MLTVLFFAACTSSEKPAETSTNTAVMLFTNTKNDG